MTQFDEAPMVPLPGGGLPEIPGTSKAAVASLVLALCAVLVCIPFLTPLAGLIFGIVALVGISRSGGRRKGRGLALAGVVISSLAVLMHVGLTVMVVGVVKVANVPPKIVASFIEEVEHGDWTAARTHLSPDTAEAVTDEQLADLRDELSETYGSIHAVTWDWTARALQSGRVGSQQPWFGPQVYGGNWKAGGQATSAGPIPIRLDFSGGPAYGVMTMYIDPNSRVTPPLFLESFKIMEDDGLWTFPPQPTTTTATSDDAT